MGKSGCIPSRNGVVDEKLMRPFFLGWTREVVKRVITKSPTCDIYYRSPTGKKIRSLNEMKLHLSDGLTADCFVFKREILGVGLKFETIRDARCRVRDNKTPKGEPNCERNIKLEDPEPGTSYGKSNKRKTESKEKNEKNKNEKSSEGKGEKIEAKNSKYKNSVQKSTSNGYIPKGLRNSALNKVQHSKVEREGFKQLRHKQIGRSKIVPRKKIVKKAVKKVATLNKKKPKKINEKEIESKNNDEMFLRKQLQPVVTIKSEPEEELEKGEESYEMNVIQVQIKVEKDESGEIKDEESESNDLKTIVQKNIGKYRKLREKQKSNVTQTEFKKSHTRVVNNSRAESFLKNRNNYIKPLQKGWRRELVYRSTCSKDGVQADVYYFHPSGKKFRSSREILENSAMIGGLPIEFFSFRKEAVGCGEPLEVIRCARQKFDRKINQIF